MPPTGALPIAATSMVPSCTPSRCAASPLASALAMCTSTLIRPRLRSAICFAKISIVSFSGLPPEVAVPAFHTMADCAGTTDGAPRTAARQRTTTRARQRYMVGSPRSRSGTATGSRAIIGSRPCVTCRVEGGQDAGGRPMHTTTRIPPRGGSAMREPLLDGLHARLERLEREVGWWRRVGVAALAGVGLFGAIAATVTTNPDEMKTRRPVITDGEGRGRAVLTVDESDRTRLSLTDRDGATTADLTVIPGQSAALSVGRGGAQAQLASVRETAQLSVAARVQRGWLVASPGGSSLALGNDPGK